MSPSRVSPKTRGQAQALRSGSTPTERRLWPALKLVHVSGSHFRRQVPLGPFITDFACHKTKVVIELDGSQHTDEDAVLRDEARTAWLATQGYKVLRFQNPDVTHNLDGVIEAIREVIWEREIEQSS